MDGGEKPRRQLSRGAGTLVLCAELKPHMARSVFDPPLDLRGVKVRTRDEASDFARNYVGSRSPRRRDGVLRDLEAASGKEQERAAARAFEAWAKAEGLL